MNLDEIFDNIDCRVSLDDEILKFYCLLSCCMSPVKQNDEDFISRNYVVSKAARLMGGVPIILDSRAKSMYVRIKIERQKGLPPLQDDLHEKDSASS